MKALVRNKGETITEDMHIPCIDWETGKPLTDSNWFGGPYKLVENEPAQYVKAVEPKHAEIESVDDYVVIDGKKYSKKELRSLLE